MAITTMQGWLPRAGSRLSSVWLALLLVLHGAAPMAHPLSSAETRPLLVALAAESGSTLRPFSFFGQLAATRSETRPLAGPPDRASAQDSPAAILPLAVALWNEGAAEAPRFHAATHPRPKRERAFEARAPPTNA